MATKRRPIAGLSGASLVHTLFSDETLGRLLVLHAIFLAPLVVGDALPTLLFQALGVAISVTTLLLVLVVAGQLAGRRTGQDSLDI